MSDEIREIKIAIKSTTDSGAIEKATSQVNDLTKAIEKETAAEKSNKTAIEDRNKTLATPPPDLNASTAAARPAKDTRFEREAEAAALRQTRLAVESEVRAAQSLLAKELSANVSPSGGDSESGGGAGASGLLRSLRSAASAVPGFSRLATVVGALATPFAAAAAAAAGFFAAIRVGIVSMREFADQQARIRELNEALAVSGKVSMALSESIRSLGDELEKGTGVGSEKWLGAFQELLRSGTSANQLRDFAQKLSVLTGLTGNFESATTLLTGALKGNFEGFQQLGIFIPQHASQTEKLALLYKQLAEHTDILAKSQSEASKETVEFNKAIHEAMTNVGGFVTAMIHSSPQLATWISIINLVGRQFKDTGTAAAGLAADTSKLVPIIYDHAEATRIFNEQLKGEEDRLKGIEEITNRAIERDKRASDAKKSLIDLQKEYNLNVINAAEDAGKRGEAGGISAVTASRARLQITRQSELAQNNIEQQRFLREIAAKKKEADDAQKKGADLWEASYQVDRAQAEFDDAKAAPTIDGNGQKLKQLEDALEHAKKRLEITRELAKKERELREEIKKLQAERGESALAAAGKIAVDDVRVRNDIANQHAQEKEARRTNPNSPITSITPSDTAIDPSFNRAIRQAAGLVGGDPRAQVLAVGRALQNANGALSDLAAIAEAHNTQFLSLKQRVKQIEQRASIKQ